MRRAVAVLGICGAAAGLARGQDFPLSSDLRDWYATGPLQDKSQRWWAAEDDFHTNWIVSTQGGRARVRLERRHAAAPAPLPFEIKRGEGDDRNFYGYRQAIQVEDGWIVSFNDGHWGGAIWWFAPDGKQRYRFSEANLIDLLPTSTGLFFIAGVVHGFDDGGVIERLERGPDGRWSSRVVVHLTSSPGAALDEERGTLLVATSEQVVRFDPATRKLAVVVDHLPWHMLYPTSIAVEASGRIFVGMRHGVARIDPKPDGVGYSVNWLIPCATFDTNKRPPGFH